MASNNATNNTTIQSANVAAYIISFHATLSTTINKSNRATNIAAVNAA